MQNDLTIGDLITILRKRLTLLTLLPFCVAMTVLAVCLMLPSRYTATASLYVAVRYEDGSGNLRFDTSAGNSLASDYKALFERSPVLRATGEALGIHDLSQAIRFDVAGVTGTRIVEIQATGKEPVLCANAANTASHIFTEYLAAYMGVDSAGITQQAEIPQEPSSPRPLLYAMIAGFGSLCACALCVLVLDQANNRIKNESQITQQLNLPLLASVPDYRKALKRYLTEGERAARLYRYMPVAVREGAKTAAMNTVDAAIDSPVRTLAVTSVIPEEGKSSLAALIASAYAEEGKRVLLVDMDFRSPSLGTLLKTHGEYDLIDCLTNRVPLQEAAVSAGTKGLYLLDSHHKTARTLRIIASRCFADFLEQARAQFDIVLFDTPPLGLFIDAALLSAKLDGVVLAVAENHVDVAAASKAVAQLTHSKAEVFGAVLNYVKMPEAYYEKNRRKQHTRVLRTEGAAWN